MLIVEGSVITVHNLYGSPEGGQWNCIGLNPILWGQKNKEKSTPNEMPLLHQSESVQITELAPTMNKYK